MKSDRTMMKKQLVLTLAALFMSIASCMATTYITVNSNVNLPVYFKTPNGTFKITSRNTTMANVSGAGMYNVSFTDANGNRCRVDARDHVRSGQETDYYFTVTSVISSGYSNYDNSGSNYDNSSGYGSSSGDDVGYNLGRSAIIGMSIPCEGHPFLSTSAGMSFSCGEFARVKFVTGGVAGLVLSGSIGKEWIFKRDYADKISWNASLGLRFGDPNTDISLNMAVGRTPWDPDLALMMNLELEHFFGDAKRFGVFGAVGLAATDLDEKRGKAKCHFDCMVGVSVKLWQK